MSRPRPLRSCAVWIRPWIPLESMTASPPRSRVRSPPFVTSRPSASDSIPTFEASSSPTRRYPLGSSVRSSCRSMRPPSDPVSTGEGLHAGGVTRNAARPDPQHQDGHVVTGILLAELEHGLLDPFRDGIRVEPP